eukprot:1834278-Rhodomonas_salina.1
MESQRAAAKTTQETERVTCQRGFRREPTRFSGGQGANRCELEAVQCAASRRGGGPADFLTAQGPDTLGQYRTSRISA